MNLRICLPMITVVMTCLSVSATDEPSPRVDAPLTDSERQAIESRYKNVLATVPRPAVQGPNAANVYSVRGDANFFLGRFKNAVDEYELMVKVDPRLDKSHWRLGIAYFFADQPQKAVEQFEKYQSYDDVDRENGIWRYLSQFKATDGKTAKRELIRYEKDDRQPFPTVYKLFDGSVTPKQALSAIPENLRESDRDSRLFYTELYIGMHLVVQDKPAKAKAHLVRSVQNKWPRTAGYGPRFMWHVGRLQLDLLNKAAEAKPESKPGQ